MVTELMVDEWDPSAYILRGQHCPKVVIRETLKSTMRALGASKMIHVAFHDQGIFGDLSFAIGYSDEFARKVDHLLARAAAQPLASLCVETVRNLRSESILDEQAARELAIGIGNIRLRKYSLTRTEAEFFTEQVRSGVYLTNTGSLDISAERGDMQSLVLLDVTPITTGLLHRAGLAHDLAVQLKSTAEASALSDNMVMRRVVERLHPKDRALSTRTFSDIAMSALDLALDVTSSRAGAIYFFSTKPGHPFERLVAHESEIFPDRIAREDSGLLTAVVEQNMAIQQSNWSLSTDSKAQSRSSGGVFLLSPIGGSGVDPRRPAIGALILYRDDATHAFSAYDLALTRNVALRISLARTTDVMSRIGSVTSALRTRTDWMNLLRTLKEAPKLEALSGVHLPTDVRLAAKRIAPELADLAALTDSHSVSLRLALPWAKATQSHGLALVRVAFHTEASRGSELQVQTEEIGGFNWICMHKDDIVYAPDVARHPGYVGLRPDTVSELTVPVRVEGSLVGVLNLESSLYDAYEILRPLITSFSGAVARTLADARASLEDRVIDSAAQALNHRHTMESRLDHLRNQVIDADLDSPLATSLSLGFERIQSELDAMRKVTSFRVEKDATLPQILERAAEEVSYLGELPHDMWSEKFSTPISGRRTRALQVVIANILSNLMNYTSASVGELPGTPLREIAMSSTYLEDRAQLVLDFRNYADEYVNSARIADLYRCPLPDSGGRLRVGGVLAGLNARRANARLQSALLDDGRTVRTTLIVPVRD